MQAALYVSLIPICAVASLSGFASWIGKEAIGLRRAGEWLGITCFALTLVTWLLRWRLAGHFPIFGTYESALSLSVAVLATALIMHRVAGSTGLWPVACGVTAALLAHGQCYDATAYPLTISERSWIVDVHAVLAWAAFGCLAANAGLALVMLFGSAGASERIRRLLPQSLSIGFMLHSAMLVSGSFYGFLLFGQVWSFDPIETLGFVAWIAYGTLLHLHLFAAWEGIRLAKWCLLLFVLLTISYRFIVYFPAWSTYHIFDMDLRMHIDPSGPAAVGGGE